MRPEVVAFNELNVLVRNLTEQLAGYRRRALAAETHQKELEHSWRAARELLDAAVEQREAAEASVQELSTVVHRTLERNVELEALLAAVDANQAQADGAIEPASDPFAEENARLRARLAEAKERASQLGDRVRFLRQQMAQGVER